MSIQQSKILWLKEKLLSEVTGDFLLPEEVELNTIYSIEETGIYRGGKQIKFVINKDVDEAFYLDYYVIAEAYTSHHRIFDTGEIVPLENYEGQYGLPVYQAEKLTKLEHERIKKHNETVLKILKNKGFEK